MTSGQDDPIPPKKWYVEEIYWLFVVSAVFLTLVCIILTALSFRYTNQAGAAAQSLAGVIAAIAMGVAVWSVFATQRVAGSLDRNGKNQRTLSAFTEVNSMWMQINLDRHDQYTEPDLGDPKLSPVRLRFVFQGLCVLRQIWMFQEAEDLPKFWQESAVYWSHRIRKYYPVEWQFVIGEHRGYDPNFIKKVISWSLLSQPHGSELQEYDSENPV